MSAPLPTMLLIALGGALGAIARFVVVGLVAQRWGAALPWGTLVVNSSGSFLLGLVLATTHSTDTAWRLLLATGFCGGYTTFSSFVWETVSLSELGEHRPALANSVGSVLLCLLTAFAGGALGAVLVGGG